MGKLGGGWRWLDEKDEARGLYLGCCFLTLFLIAFMRMAFDDAMLCCTLDTTRLAFARRSRGRFLQALLLNQRWSGFTEQNFACFVCL